MLFYIFRFSSGDEEPRYNFGVADFLYTFIYREISRESEISQSTNSLTVCA